jgi:PAS domain S-box-containing protein
MRVLPRRLNMQAILLVTGILLATGAASGWVVAQSQSKRLLASMHGNAEVLVKSLSAIAARHLVLQDFAGLESYLLKSAELPDIERLQVCEMNGRIVGDVERRHDLQPRARLGIALISPPPPGSPPISFEDGVMIVWEPIEAGSQLGWIKATYGMTSIREAQAETLRESLSITLIGTACSIVLLLLVLRPTALAFKRLNAFARRLDECKGDQIDAGYPAVEIEELGASLNFASSRLFATEQQLVQARERLRVTLRSIHDGVIAADADGTIVFMNHSSELLTEWLESDATGRTIGDVFRLQPWPHDRGGSFLQTLLGSGSATELSPEATLTAKSGRVLAIHGSIAPIPDEGGIITGMVIVFRDVDEQRKAERKNRQLAAIVQSSDDAIISKDLDGTITTWNRGAESIYGYSEREIVGKPVSVLVPPELHDEMALILRRVRAGEHVEHLETVRLRKDGTRIPVSVTASPIRDSDGRVVAASTIARDMTDRRQAEQRLALLDFALNNVREEAFLIDEQACLRYVNDESCRALGYSREELLGLHVADIDPDFPVERWTEHWSDLRMRGATTFEGRHRARDGRIYPVEISANYFEFGGCGYNLALARDISERTKTQSTLRESEKRYKQLLDSVTDYIYTVLIRDNRPVATVHGPGCASVTGYTPEDYAADPGLWYRMVYEPDRAAVMAQAAGILAGEPVPALEHRILHRDGTLRWVRNTPVPRHDDQWHLVAYDGLVADITERKLAERERLSSLKFFESMDKVNRCLQGTNVLEQLMSDVLSVVLSVFDADRAWLFYPCDPGAPSFRVPMEITKPEYPGAKILNVDVPTPPDMGRNLREALESTDPVTYTVGTERPVNQLSAEQFGVQSMMLTALRPKSGKPWAFGLHQCSCPRIWTAEEKRLFQEIGRRLTDALTGLLTYRELQESETKYRRLVDTSNEGIWMLGEDLLTTFVNARMADLLGYQPTEMVGRPMEDFMFAEDIPDHRRREESRRRGISEHYERRYSHKNGQAVWTLASAVPILDAEQHCKGSFAMFTDITERKRAEETRERLTVAIEQAAETVVVTDADGTILYVNPMFETVTGYARSEAVGRNPRILKSDKQDDAFYRTLWTTITSGRVWHGRFVNRKKDGSLFSEDATISPVHDETGRIVSYVAVKRDITEQLRAVEEKSRLEDQLHQAQKMEAIGTLAGGVAHDFNNILTAIIGYGSLVQMGMKPDDPQQAALEQILQAADRAAHLTQGLLAFSRKQVIRPRPVDLNTIVKSVGKLLQRLIGEDIELTTVYDEHNLIAMADPGQIEQVLMNLATNARDAMPGGGALTITTEEIHLNEDFINAHAFGKPGLYAQISVSDTGSGMDEQTREKIFEPFFTTKALGKGTGLGLAIVYGIVKQHEGSITVYSEPGKGTTFKVYLPLIAAPEIETRGAVAPRPQGGTETILLAEDDTVVRDLTKTILAEFGYRVIEAVDGEDAIEKYARRGKEIDLLIVDVVMPKKSGREVYDAVKSTRPDANVLFISGYTADIIHKKGIFEEGIEFISKPVSPFDLLRKIRTILDKNPRSGPVPTP